MLRSCEQSTSRFDQVPGSTKLSARLEKLACKTASLKIAIFSQFGEEQLRSGANGMYLSPKSLGE